MDLNTLFGLPAGVTAAPESSGAHARVESVIGIDHRVRVADASARPWRKICCLSIEGKNGAVSRGTGWLVGPRTLLTAGHCVYSTLLFDGWAEKITIEAGRDNDWLPFGSVSSTSFSALRDWVELEAPEADVGCIQLAEPLGSAVGWFHVDTTWDDSPEPGLVTIAGYPVDRDRGNVMYFNRNSLLHSSHDQLFYDVDTVGGQSGAPIWVTGHDGEPRVIGLHAYGASGLLDPDLGVQANSGRRLTSQLLVTIALWLCENPGGFHA